MTESTVARTADGSLAKRLRAVGAVERLFYRYGERNPIHFSLVAEFDIVLTEERVKTALGQVQDRHPLLSVHVEDSPTGRLGLYRAAAVASIPLTVRADVDWRSVATEELTHPFDRSAAPLIRAILVTSAARSAIVLTFDHTIADGISSISVLEDIVMALNGVQLVRLSVPPTGEALLDRRWGSTQDGAPPTDTGVPDPRMLQPTSLRLFDGTRSHIHTAVLGGRETTRLVEICRREGTTVHSAIVTAASRVRGEQLGMDYVRVLSPINFRSHIDDDAACADYFICAVTGMAPSDGATFWEQARAAGAQLGSARSAGGVLATSAAVADAIGTDAEVGDAEALFTTVLPFDLLISNLGAQDLKSVGPLRPSAVWAPVLETQIAGSTVIGVTTYQGVLRMVASGYSPTDEYLEAVAAYLRDIVG